MREDRRTVGSHTSKRKQSRRSHTSSDSSNSDRSNQRHSRRYSNKKTNNQHSKLRHRRRSSSKQDDRTHKGHVSKSNRHQNHSNKYDSKYDKQAKIQGHNHQRGRHRHRSRSISTSRSQSQQRNKHSGTRGLHKYEVKREASNVKQQGDEEVKKEQIVKQVPCFQPSDPQIRPYVMDLQSTNGTILNGQRIEPCRYYQLLDKDKLQFGKSTRIYIIVEAGEIEGEPNPKRDVSVQRDQ